MSHHEIRFPNESADYRTARDDLLAAEMALRERLEEVARLRRSLPPGGPLQENYQFDEIASGDHRQVAFSELFQEGHDSLLVYSYMFSPAMASPCPACTSLIDGFDAIAPQLAQRVSLVVVGQSPIERLHELAGKRGWRKVRLLSSVGNSYHRDYHGENAGGDQLPLMNVFTRADGTIRHFYATELLFAPSQGHPRHMDLAWPIWNLLDMTPGGRGDWFPDVL